MNYKKNSIWLFVFLTVVRIYLLFHLSSIPLLYVYFIHRFVCSRGLTITGLIGREYLVGKIILMAIIIAISAFSIIVMVICILGGIGMICWFASFLYPAFNRMLIFGFIISALFIVNENVQRLKSSDVNDDLSLFA